MSELELFKQACETEFGKLHVKLDILDACLRGNGKVGLITRLDRLEIAAASRGRCFWLVIGIIATLAIGAVWRYVGSGV